MEYIMNHREIESGTLKAWEERNFSLDEVKDIFDKDEDRQIYDTFCWVGDKSVSLAHGDVLLDYGRDCLRLYLFFEKPPKPESEDKYMDSWEECSLEGCYKFLGKYRRMIFTLLEGSRRGYFTDIDSKSILNQIKDIEAEYKTYLRKKNILPNRHNAVATLMRGLNDISKELHVGEILTRMHRDEVVHANPGEGKVQTLAKADSEIVNICKALVQTVYPFAPYISEDLDGIINKEL